MKTLTDATLFTVKGPRGTYYAVRNQESGAVLTERTEAAAAALANEKDLVIVERQEISHAALLELLARRAESPDSVPLQHHPVDHPQAVSGMGL